MSRQPTTGGAISVQRRLFFSLLSAGLLMGVVLWDVEPRLGEPDEGWGAVVAGFGALALALSIVAGRAPLKAESADTLAAAYRTWFFIRFILAEAALLIGSLVCFIVDRFWPYLVGLSFFLIGMAWIAPTRGNFARLQQRIMAQGSTLSLVDALNAPAEPRA